jgi:hypothetical protein
MCTWQIAGKEQISGSFCCLLESFLKRKCRYDSVMDGYSTYSSQCFIKMFILEDVR